MFYISYQYFPASIEQVYAFIEELKAACPDIIKKIDVVMITKEHKLDFFPEWY